MEDLTENQKCGSKIPTAGTFELVPFVCVVSVATWSSCFLTHLCMFLRSFQREVNGRDAIAVVDMIKKTKAHFFTSKQIEFIGVGHSYGGAALLLAQVSSTRRIDLLGGPQQWACVCCFYFEN